MRAQWRATGPSAGGRAPLLGDHVSARSQLPADGRRGRLDRRLAHTGRALSRALRAAQRRYTARPRSRRSCARSLLATFNSGFKLEDDGGGFVASGHVYAPLTDGQATLIGLPRRDSRHRTWTAAPDPGPEIEFARQNLPLIVEDGQLNPPSATAPLWGATLGNAVRVWRSGIGVDAHGNLIYAAADDQTAQSLAQILQRAGAVRAMELDINYEWTTFNFYGTFGAGEPTKLLPGMDRSATRYLTPDDRDFFAVYARNEG